MGERVVQYACAFTMIPTNLFSYFALLCLDLMRFDFVVDPDCHKPFIPGISGRAADRRD